MIGTGVGRTGMDSMRELIQNPEHERLWRSVVAGATPDEDLLLGNSASWLQKTYIEVDRIAIPLR